MFEIRAIRADEHDLLFEMLYEAIFVPAGEEQLPRTVVNEPHLSKYVEDFGREGDLALVLTHNDSPAGAIWSRIFSTDHPGYGFVDEGTPELSMAIRPEYRGQGFGTLLLEKFIAIAAADGHKKISLSVDKRNAAVRLYERTDFKILEENGTAYTMIKIINK